MGAADDAGMPLLALVIPPAFCVCACPAGMMFVLLYGRKGLFAPLIAKFGFPIVFAFPGGWVDGLGFAWACACVCGHA